MRFGGNADAVQDCFNRRSDGSDKDVMHRNGGHRRQSWQAVAVGRTRARQHGAAISGTVTSVRHRRHITRVCGHALCGLARRVVHGRTIGHRGRNSTGAAKHADRTDTRRQCRQGGGNDQCENGSNDRHSAALHCDPISCGPQAASSHGFLYSALLGHERGLAFDRRSLAARNPACSRPGCDSRTNAGCSRRRPLRTSAPARAGNA